MRKLMPLASAMAVGWSALALAGAARPLAAQQDTAAIRLGGVVADERTLVPVPGARISVMGTDLEAVSESDGTFAFTADEVKVGPATVRVDAPGFPTMVEEVMVTDGAVVFVQFILPSVDAFLEEILVIGRGRGRPPSLRENRTAADLLVGELPGVNINPGMIGVDPADLRLRGVGSISAAGEPIVYLNGIRMAGGLGETLSLLRQIPATDVKDVQLLRGPAAAFLHGAADGVILVTTRSGSSGGSGNE